MSSLAANAFTATLPPSSATLFAACLCAQWCGTCREYQARFTEAQALFPQATWLWVDVEEKAQWVEPLDLEDFPTLLLAVNGKATFFGTLTPQAETLARLLRAKLSQDSPSLADPQAQALLERLQGMPFTS